MYQGHLSLLDTLIPLNACLVTNKYKCGKPYCKCNQGHLHQSTALKYRVNGVQKKKYVKKTDVAKVRQQLYWAKGSQFFDRDERYTLAIFYTYPDLLDNEYCIKAYELFGQQKLTPESLLAN